MAGVWRCMLVVVALGLWSLAMSAKSRQRPQKRPRKNQGVEEIGLIQPVPNIDIQRMTGTWYLINVASKCAYLINHGISVEPTTMTLTRPNNPGQTLSVSTKTRHNHNCWEILQVYHLTKTPGQLTLKGDRPELNIDIVIRDTDYTSYAILYYQKRGQTTIKLYTRNTDDLPEPLLDKFEQLAEKERFGLAYMFPFPTYSHCGDVAKDYIINCVPTC
ncbi:complement component C8 gamma chain [Parambassis ranga]|uniref:Complement component C8 gamma chain n=1 Tax=Parambassis ranga TaxID=210632 RepID=A0A6P7KIH3_9TELE|nr:complement component C8 gamma chain [Parambassis ranga]XP_028289370.1 complement component C8 gamma chain [Parambassis ranga]